MTTVYLALGSNQASPLDQISSALEAIDQIVNSKVVAVSSFYRTPPLGPAGQPDYLNAAVALETILSADELLTYTQQIELAHGRVRKAHRWGPRTLDIDIMLFGNEVINNDRLIVPHYDMHNRAFMLIPLLDIAPECALPNGQKVSEILERLPQDGITLW